MSETYIRSSASRPRRRNRLLLVLFTLIVLAVLLLGVDRGAAWLVGQQQAEQLQRDFGMSQTPEVTFDGFPFLTQLIAGNFERVEVHADELTVAAGEQQFTLQDTDLELLDVRGITEPVATQLNGTGVLDWNSVASLVGAPVSYAGSDAAGTGRIQVDYTAQVFGSAVTATVIGTPMLDPEAQTLTLGEAQVSVAGYELPEAVSNQLINQFAGDIPLSLPLNLKVDELSAESAGMNVAISGSEVNFSGN
ncbi:DUF2993 domain-containing protein [Naumannella halotolerans]|uniref:DUF2993 family protein n=1 Tax=Naumannella halotolerans TaxID=993414 RepID=A0A4V3EN91_9ACTN|nr:DUF2993 domain-containing protein [Naumannella halotolerans]TDT32938.1 Protein of unknown function (DUF2993) [Naumannella halotolerans]